MADFSNRATIRAKYRGEYRKDLREKLNAEAAIAEICELEQLLRDKFETLTPPQVGALRTVIESKWKKIAKVLPDLKAVEHEPGENAEQLTRDQMAHELALLHARISERMHGRGAEADSSAVPSAGSTH